MFGGRLPAGTELVPEFVTPGAAFYWPVETIPIIVGSDLEAAEPFADEFGSFGVSFLLTVEAGTRLQAATSEMIGRKMALILREESGPSVLFAPVIQAAIANQGVIQGSFTEAQARKMADRMLAGSRAMPLAVDGPLPPVR
jgi:preprotein translocase subunit SecD